MFDWMLRGAAPTHRYRGYYDAGKDFTTRCEQCSRHIRFCYSLHDTTMRSFVIGTCCFKYYEGTKTLVQLQAAEVLQQAVRVATARDVRMVANRGGLLAYRRRWTHARFEALKLVRDYRKLHGEWLPKELFTLQSEATKMPRSWGSYKRPTSALRWFEVQTAKLAQQTKTTATLLDLSI